MSRPKFAIAEPQPIYQKIVQDEHNGGVYQNTGIDIVEMWHCRVSMFTIIYKTFNINSLSNQIVEDVSKLCAGGRAVQCA